MSANDDIESVEYQAQSAVEHRPCGSNPCREEFSGMPSRWCSGCLIQALLQHPAVKTTRPDGNVLQRLNTILGEMWRAWDSDADSRVGKMIGSLGGRKGYRRDIDQLREDISRLEWSLRQCDIMARRQLAKSHPIDGSHPSAWVRVRGFCASAGINSDGGPLRITDDLQVGDGVHVEGVYNKVEG